MKTNFIRISLLLVLLAAVPQMSATATFVGTGQNSNSSTTAAALQPLPNLCRRKCMIVYRRCLHAAGTDPAKRKACALRYRACLRHCGRR